MSYRAKPFILAALVFLGLFVGLTPAAQAQTISQPNGDSNFRTTFFGQSFIATVNGQVTHISIRSRDVRTTTLYLYDRVDTGQFNGPGTPVSQQTVMLVDQGGNAAAAGFQTFALASPLPVTAGQTYSFAFGNADLAHSTSNPYSGGTYFTSGQSPNGPGDLAFEIVQVQAVPTLSEWALILMGLLVAGGAAVHLQRRQRPRPKAV